MNKKLAGEMFDNSVRAETVIHLATMAWQDDSWPDAVRDAFDDDFEDVVDVLGIEIDVDSERDEIAEQLVDFDKGGWLVKFATPVPRNITESGYSFTWGHYTMKWFYGDDYDQLCRDALDWKDKFIERRRAKEQAA